MKQERPSGSPCPSPTASSSERSRRVLIPGCAIRVSGRMRWISRGAASGMIARCRGRLAGRCRCLRMGLGGIGAGWGRYSQSDPMGYHSAGSRRPLNSLFGYAEQNSLRFVDPLGLVHWDCSYGGLSVYAGVGFSLYGVTCVSDCVDNERQVGTYIVKAVGAGGGLTLFPTDASFYELEDDHFNADASNLEGVFDMINASVSWDGGISAYWVRQGDGWGRWPGAIGDTWGGRGAGGFVARGSSVLLNRRAMRCCPLPYPKIGPR